MCRDFADFSMGMNVPPPVMNMNMNMNREEFEARKANMRRKQENERLGERYY
jgi:E3 ubiquitin-protein ligase RBBP6